MIGLLGGTFDPIHRGHLDLATQLMQAFELQRVEFLPCYLPVHREGPKVSASQRGRMVELAVEAIPGFTLNSIELERAGPSFAVDTLRQLKERRPDEVICWLMGADAFNGFTRWKEPDRILQMAHLIVCSRPGSKVDPDVFPASRLAPGESLRQHAAGRIVLHEMSPNPCSATSIRNQLTSGRQAEECLPLAVLDFIRNHKLYQS
jgi:nicotinate-nucleotide adenylyltransferase